MHIYENGNTQKHTHKVYSCSKNKDRQRERDIKESYQLRRQCAFCWWDCVGGDKDEQRYQRHLHGLI